MRLALVVSSLWISSLFARPTPPPLPPPLEGGREPSTPALHGREIYAEQCAVCHGTEGQGTLRGLALRLVARDYASAVVRQGRQGNPSYEIPMPAYSKEQVTDKQLAEIWNYLEQLSARTSGLELYEGYCANCHGKDAKGGPSQQALPESLETLRLWIRWGQDPGAYLSRGTYMPRWNAWEISEQDIKSIHQHILSLQKGS